MEVFGVVVPTGIGLTVIGVRLRAGCCPFVWPTGNDRPLPELKFPRGIALPFPEPPNPPRPPAIAFVVTQPRTTVTVARVLMKRFMISLSWV